MEDIECILLDEKELMDEERLVVRICLKARRQYKRESE